MDGREVFGRGRDNALWHTRRAESSDDWSDWSSLGGWVDPRGAHVHGSSALGAKCGDRTLTVTALAGVLATPASATNSRDHDTKSACLAAQRSYGGSFTRITRSCYVRNPEASGIYLGSRVMRAIGG